jgi:hypothetical protein
MSSPADRRRQRQPFWKVGLRVSVIAFVGGVYFAITGGWALAVTAFVLGAAFTFPAWKSAGRTSDSNAGSNDRRSKPKH